MTRQSRSSLLILVASSAFVLIAIVAAAIFISQNAGGSKGDAATPATQVPTKGTGYQAETPPTPIATSTMTSSPTDPPVIPPATPSQTVPTIPPPTPNPPTLTIPIAVLPEEPVCRYVKVILENPADLEELHSKADFLRVTNAGVREAHVHDVRITKQAPNYQIDEDGGF